MAKQDNIKAAMISHLQTQNPALRFIRTNNAEENAAMLGINVAMGFEPWASLSEWKIQVKG